MIICAWAGSIFASLGFGIVIGSHLKGSIFSSKKCQNLYSASESGDNSKV